MSYVALRGEQRFSLLLLEENEYYFHDAGVNYWDEVTASSKQKGRVKICSSSLIFVPDKIEQPIIRFSFKEITLIEALSKYSEAQAADTFVIETKAVILMKENNHVGPYIFKPAEGSRHVFSLSHTSLETFMRLVMQLFGISKLDHGDREVEMERVIEEREQKISFDPTWFEDGLIEKVLFEGKAAMIFPLVTVPGRLVVSNRRIYIQPFSNVTSSPVIKIALSAILRVVPKRRLLRNIGLELSMKAGECAVLNASTVTLGAGKYSSRDSLFLSFSTAAERDNVHAILGTLPDVQSNTSSEKSPAELLAQWQSGQLSNFEYLMALNMIADRSFNDITQYPVFPWVISDYDSTTLDLTSRMTFRDLSKPIGAINPERLQFFRQRYAEMPDTKEVPKFMYGTHYSTPGYLLHFLLRSAPELMLKLHNGKFDAADRLYSSHPKAWISCTSSPADVKELIPEFYSDDPSFLVNHKNLDLGEKQNGGKVEHVELPPWAATPQIFLNLNRQALESEYVSENLHHWVDLIFGFKQRGSAAVAADNLFYYLTYEGAVDIDSVRDPVERRALLAQIREFGQCPKQLFTTPHPPRNGSAISAPSPLPPPSSPSPAAEISRVGNNNRMRAPSHGEIIPLVIRESDLCSPLDLRDDLISAQEPRDEESKNVWDALHCVKPGAQFKHKEGVEGVAFSADENQVYSVSQDSCVRTYCLKDKRMLSCFAIGELALSSLSVDHFAKNVIVSSWDNNIYVYNVDQGRIVDELSAHDDAVSAVVLANDLLLSASWDGTAKIWKYSPTGLSKTPLAVFSDSESEIKSVDINSAGNLAVCGGDDGSVVLWDLRSKAMVCSVHPHSSAVTSVKFCESRWSARPLLVTASKDGRLCVFDSGNPTTSLASMRFEDAPNSVATDGTQLLVGDINGRLHVLNLDSGRELNRSAAIKGHSKAINALCVNTTGSLLVSASDDATLRIWTP